ncbi:50S ribosomal protein L11 methyltransferase [Campylobacter sp. LR264d]|uniref:50S ribosomal protein L11 methyltransferase n=1 Tax=Campylobacter sp. LR264d TaxID=2593544 RepID=UPI001239176D|nr:50S ribosomal protein L11 methyltransferase [Campylobacter sp. LR264d]KAA6234491.1 50S ribosomal protein L11 methyltransferase [Campylobacter sp. LR264d]
MKKSYYELFFKSDENYKALFIDLVFDLGIEAIEEKDSGIYLRSIYDLTNISTALSDFATKLSKLYNKEIFLEQNITKKENKDYIEEYKKNIQPILIDKFYIHTSWQKDKKNLKNIIIDPALAFGSGHHESTYSCLKLLQKFAKKDMKALDLGCGSGILGMALCKLKASVECCDTDELAIKSSLKNAKLNKVKFKKTWCGSINKATHKYDLIVANLVFDIINILHKDIKKHLKDNAILILSGILKKHADLVKENFKDLKLLESLEMNEWLSLVYKNDKKGIK